MLLPKPNEGLDLRSTLKLTLWLPGPGFKVLRFFLPYLVNIEKEGLAYLVELKLGL